MQASIKEHLIMAIVFLLMLFVYDANAALSEVKSRAVDLAPVAVVDGDAGRRYFENGFYRLAIKAWRQDYQAYLKDQDLAGQIEALYKIATAQRMLGLHDRAVRALEVAGKLARLVPDTGLALSINANLGGAYLYAGHPDIAKSLLNQARLTARESNNPKILALVLNDFGNYYAFTGQADKALQSFTESRDLAKQLGDAYLQVQVATNAIIVAADNHQIEQAVNDIVLAGIVIDKLPPSIRKADAVLKLAHAGYRVWQQSGFQNMEMLPGVVARLRQQVGYTQQIQNHWLTAKLLMAQADFYEQAQQYQDAQVLANKAIFQAQLADDDSLTYRLQWQVARISRHLKDDDRAATYYRQAISTLQPIRHLLSDQPYQASSYQEQAGNIYLEFADLLLRHARQASASRASVTKVSNELLLEARNVLERQKSEELQNYFKNQCVVESQAKAVELEKTLDDATAVVYPVLLPDRTELLVSYRSGIRQYVVDTPEAEVTDQVRKLRVKLEKRRTRDYLPYANRLYRILISPLEIDLQQHDIKTLVFIPGQSLRTIPIAVLHDGNQFLIDKYAVATTPGLTLTDSRPLKRANMKVLLSGISEPVQGYPPLDYVEGELEQIRDLFGAKMLLNKGFVKNSVTSELQAANYNVAHFASHAEFAGDVSHSFILTFDDRLSVNQLGRYVSIGQYKNKPIELLTLSACNTAAGDDRAALGLAGVAVQAGARSALASLWAINDKASAMLVTEFYRQLQDDQVTKAQALQRAQQKLMHNVRYRHPGFWSPFLLIGNWL